MAELSGIGVWLLAACALVIVIEGALAAIWGVAIARGTRELSKRMAAEQVLITADLARLKLALEETRRLWKPYRRALRWLRHPLAVALLDSYARRRTSAR